MNTPTLTKITEVEQHIVPSVANATMIHARRLKSTGYSAAATARVAVVSKVDPPRGDTRYAVYCILQKAALDARGRQRAGGRRRRRCRRLPLRREAPQGFANFVRPQRREHVDTRIQYATFRPAKGSGRLRGHADVNPPEAR